MYSLLLMYISSYLTKHDVDNLLIDPKGDGPEAEITGKTIDETVAWQPDIVGISCLTGTAPRAYEIGDRFRI